MESLDPVLLVVCAILAILAVLGWVAAAVTFGLWRGEVGRRRDIALLTGRDAERTREDGHATIRRREPPEEAAARVAEVQAVAQGLMDEARADGKKISTDEATKEARRLLAELDPTNMSA